MKQLLYENFNLIKVKVINALIIVILIKLTTLSIYSQNQLDNFYYYKGAKVYLEINKQKISVSFKSKTSLNTFSSLNTSQPEVIEDNSSPFLTPLVSTNSNKETLEKVYYSEVKTTSSSESDYMSSIEKHNKLSNVLMASPTYKIDGEIVGLSNKFYVKLKKIEDVELLQLEADKMDIKILGQVKFMPLWFVLSIPSPRNLNALNYSNIFYETGLFESTEPAFMNHTTINTNDDFFDDQWALKNTGQRGGTIGIDANVEQAWDISTGNNIRVAIFDQGVELTHPDLEQNISRDSFDAQTGTSPSQIRGDHGTACAGIIGAISGNNIGVVGVAPDSELMPISVNFGFTTTSLMLANGMNWAWMNGADIISNSWSGGAVSSLFDDAITSALTNGRDGLGSIVVFSSGNNNDNGSVYPPNSNPLILCVGAIDRCGVRSGRIDIVPDSCDPWSSSSLPGSSFGTPLDIVAGGTNIATTDLTGSLGYRLGDYELRFGGTSAACPIVSGVAALVLGTNPELTVEQVNTIIEQSAQKVREDIYTYSSTNVRPNGSWNNELGYGLVNAYEAVLLAQNHDCVEEIIVTEDVLSGEFDVRVASKSIIASNTLNIGASGDYRAGKLITLTNGFYAKPGSIFNSHIEDCGNESSVPSFVSSNNVNNTVEISTEQAFSFTEDIENNISIYPNPTSSFINVQCDLLIMAYSINSIIGEQVMLKENLNVTILNIDLSSLPNGIYFIETLKENGEIVQEKIIKN